MVGMGQHGSANGCESDDQLHANRGLWSSADLHFYSACGRADLSPVSVGALAATALGTVSSTVAARQNGPQPLLCGETSWYCGANVASNSATPAREMRSTTVSVATPRKSVWAHAGWLHSRTSWRI